MVSKAQLIYPTVHPNLNLNAGSLGRQLVTGIYRTAIPSPIHVGWLQEAGQFCKKRITKGREQMAACGQLGNRGLRRKGLRD